MFYQFSPHFSNLFPWGSTTPASVVKIDSCPGTAEYRQRSATRWWGLGVVVAFVMAAFLRGRTSVVVGMCRIVYRMYRSRTMKLQTRRLRDPSLLLGVDGGPASSLYFLLLFFHCRAGKGRVPREKAGEGEEFWLVQSGPGTGACEKPARRCACDERCRSPRCCCCCCCCCCVCLSLLTPQQVSLLFDESKKESPLFL
jgi:hypothetical protein